MKKKTNELEPCVNKWCELYSCAYDYNCRVPVLIKCKCFTSLSEYKKRKGRKQTMPVYEFTCKDCNKVFELSLPVSHRDDPDATRCECGAPTARAVGCAGFELKGSGWASDGYSTYVGDAVKYNRVPDDD